jgi:hypothetical protein
VARSCNWGNRQAAASDRELARQVQYLKAENRILRNKLPRSTGLGEAGVAGRRPMRGHRSRFTGSALRR